MTSSCSLERESYGVIVSLAQLYSGILGTRLRGVSENEATGESWREAAQLRSDIVIESSGTEVAIARGEDRCGDRDGGVREAEFAGFTV